MKYNIRSIVFLCVVIVGSVIYGQGDIGNPFDSAFQEKLSQIIDFKIGDTIKLDSPRRFLQISILFTLEQNNNYAKITSKKDVSNDEIGAFLNNQRDRFYKKLGISETEYVNYSIRNAVEIQEFLETNELFSEVYGIVQNQVTD